MKLFALFIPFSILLASCYPLTYTPYGTYNPYAETNNQPPYTPQQPPSTPADTSPQPKPPTTTPPVSKPNYPYAQAIPGEPGYVLNPYTGNKVDVSGLSRGTLVRDPHDKNPDHNFRVP